MLGITIVVYASEFMLFKACQCYKWIIISHYGGGNVVCGTCNLLQFEI